MRHRFLMPTETSKQGRTSRRHGHGAQTEAREEQVAVRRGYRQQANRKMEHACRILHRGSVAEAGALGSPEPFHTPPNTIKCRGGLLRRPICLKSHQQHVSWRLSMTFVSRASTALFPFKYWTGSQFLGMRAC